MSLAFTFLCGVYTPAVSVIVGKAHMTKKEVTQTKLEGTHLQLYLTLRAQTCMHRLSVCIEQSRLVGRQQSRTLAWNDFWNSCKLLCLCFSTNVPYVVGRNYIARLLQ